MPPKALLFCADDATLRHWAHIFHDRGLGSELCGDIFSALEAITSRDFEVIAVDWDEGAEAAFLLRTAAELKSPIPFSVVINAPPNATLPGANVILPRAMTAESFKRSLLTRDEFLARMRNWLPVSEDVEYTGLPKVPQQEPTNDILTIQETLGRLVHADPKPARVYRDTRARDLWLLSTAAIVAFSIALYHFRQPQFRALLASAVTSPEVMNQAYTEAVQDDANYLIGDDPNIIVTPVRHSSPRRSRGALPPVLATRNPEVDSLLEAVANEPVMAPQASSGDPSVPDSLHHPVPPQAIPNSTLAGAPPAVFNNLQPIDLSEDSAEMLLVKKVAPRYPEQALKLGVEGPVVFRAWIARDGTVRELKLVSGPMALVHAAYNAAKQWRYKPYSPDGEATEAQTVLTVEFQRSQLALSH
jgi:TonB family protein